MNINLNITNITIYQTKRKEQVMNINYANNVGFCGYLNKNVIPSLKKEYSVNVAEQAKNGIEKSLAEAKNKVVYEKFFAKLKDTVESCHQETEFYVDTEVDSNPVYYVNRIFARNRLAPYAKTELHSYYFDIYGRPICSKYIQHPNLLQASLIDVSVSKLNIECSEALINKDFRKEPKEYKEWLQNIKVLNESNCYYQYLSEEIKNAEAAVAEYEKAYK